MVYERPKGLTWLVTVALDEPARVTSAVPVPGVQPLVTGEQFVADSERIKQAPAFQAALARRGLTDMSAIAVDAWPAAYFGLDVDKSGRPLARAVAYALDGPNPNPYARPIENLVVIWDRDAGEIVELQDGDPVPLPTDPGRYDADGTAPHREVAELRILQPDGPGFTVDDGQLRWGPWQLRVSLHPVEGLVLHEVTYIEGDRPRPILFRASMSEMVVPYGSTAMNHWWKNAFDAGECGLGLCASSLELGCDCLGEIVYLDGVQVDAAGAATPLRNAICLHEEDYGILWKHVDARHRVSETRRSRRMVVSSISTVGNYEYGFFWYFYLDGTIQAEVKLTGIIQTQAVRPGERVPYANPVTPELAGPHHQHVFSYRLDFTLDGAANAVYEVDAVPVPTGPDNPYGNAFTAQATLLETELQAQRLAAADKSRYWKIVNHGVTQRGRRAGRLQAGARPRDRPAAGPAGRGDHQPGGVRHQAPVGDPVRGRRAAGGGRLPQPASGRRRAAPVDRGRPAGRRHRHRGLAHGRRDPLLPAGGLPGHAGGVHRVHAQAVRLLRPEPGDRPRAVGVGRGRPLPPLARAGPRVIAPGPG